MLKAATNDFDLGSSGIAVQRLLHLFERSLGGLLLGLFLRASDPVTEHLPTDAHPSGERAGVVGAFAHDDVLRSALAHLCGQFLQTRLPIQASAQSGELTRSVPRTGRG